MVYLGTSVAVAPNKPFLQATYIYIYIEREIQREREIFTHPYTYMPTPPRRVSAGGHFPQQSVVPPSMRQATTASPAQWYRNQYNRIAVYYGSIGITVYYYINGRTAWRTVSPRTKNLDFRGIVCVISRIVSRCRVLLVVVFVLVVLLLLLVYYYYDQFYYDCPFYRLTTARISEGVAPKAYLAKDRPSDAGGPGFESLLLIIIILPTTTTTNNNNNNDNIIMILIIITLISNSNAQHAAVHPLRSLPWLRKGR